MEPLSSIYIGLGVFGLGVTIVDLFGLLGHHDADHQAPTSSHESSDATLGAHDGQAQHAGLPETASASDGSPALGHHDTIDRGSLMGPGELRALSVGRFVSALRLVVSFCLGAGLTGFVALASHIAAGTSLLWSAAGGVLVAAIARLVRRVARRELDSTLTAADFIMSEGEITIGIEPGKLGRARVRRYGVDSELYVRCVDASQALAAGTRIRIVDLSEECYFVETV